MEQLFGYENYSNQLINNYKNNNLKSSSILYGPKGIGKRTFINNFIFNIFKLTYDNNKFIHHVNLFKKNVHPNIKIIEKEFDNKTKKIKTSISTDQIRNLKKFINETSSIDNFNKFIIIDSADDLNINSSNSLLKSLEEPNTNTYFFLISHQLSALIPTIRSRCLKLKFPKHDLENFKKILCFNIENLSNDEINFFYDLSIGCPGNAITMYNENITEIFEMMLDSLSDNDINNSKIEISELFSKFDNEIFLNFLSIYKTILVLLNKIKNNTLVPDEFLSHKFKKLENISKFLTKKNIIDRFNFIVNNEKDLFTYNLDKKLFMLKFFTS